MIRVLRLAGLCVLASAIAACDRTPTDPSRQAERDALLLDATTGNPAFAASSTSLPQLFRSAIAKVEKEQGAVAARQLLAEWTRLNEQARSSLRSGDRQAQVKVAAVRAEEIRIVLLVFGNGIGTQVIQEVGVNLARARIELVAAEAGGRDVTRAKGVAAQVDDMWKRANAALSERNYALALDYATQASELLDAVSHLLVQLQRIPALETFFADAVAKVARERGREAVNALLANLNRLNDEARSALRNGNRQTAQEKLEAARREQIRIVLEVLGNNVVGALMDAVDTGITRTRARFVALTEPRIAQRAETMLSEAANLNARARIARTAGDHATALDLASHAAGLVNALQHLLPRN